jgi:hypothetical protein
LKYYHLAEENILYQYKSYKVDIDSSENERFKYVHGIPEKIVNEKTFFISQADSFRSEMKLSQVTSPINFDFIGKHNTLLNNTITVDACNLFFSCETQEVPFKQFPEEDTAVICSLRSIVNFELSKRTNSKKYIHQK